MLRIRFISVAAATTIASAVAACVLAATGASAQTASADQVGKPLSLGQPLTPTAAASEPAGTSASSVKKPRLRKFASKRHKTAAKQSTDRPADTAQNNASANAWLAASATPANSASGIAPAGNVQTAQSDNAPQRTAPSPNAGLPSAVVVGGQTVQIAQADQVNAIDLAADNAPPMPSALPPGARAGMAAANAPEDSQKASQVAFVASASAATDQNADSENADAPEASTQDVSRQDVSRQDVSQQDTSQQDTSDQNAVVQTSSLIGSIAWIAQVLAALGGAVTAGVVAWFLIGAGPARTYS
jgi:hypothetical protein